MDQNRKFAEMNGLCWHEWMNVQDGTICSKCHRYSYNLGGDNPDFSDPREVLKVVTEREDFMAFAAKAGLVMGIHQRYHIPIEYITTPGKLRDAWIDWKEVHDGRTAQ
jgi:hypothetical protein